MKTALTPSFQSSEGIQSLTPIRTNETDCSVVFRIKASPASSLRSGALLAGECGDLRNASSSVGWHRVIRPFDFDSEVSKYKIDPESSSGSDMLFASRQPLDAEAKYIAKHFAMWNIKHNADKTGEVPSFTDLDTEIAYRNFSHGVDNTLAYDQASDRYLNRSGLLVKAPESWTSMKKEKHIIMRMSPLVEFDVKSERASFSGIGKIYADHFDASSKLGKLFGQSQLQKHAPGDGSSDSGDDDIESQAIMLAKPLVPTVLSFMKERYLKTMNDNYEETPELSRPPIVDCANDAESFKYTSSSSFPEGRWQLSIPSVVQDQMAQSSKHFFNSPNHTQHFIFIQDLDGNIKLSIHQDQSYHHSTPDGGRPIRTAGELFGKVSRSEDGSSFSLVVERIINKSGHYWPTLDTFGALRDDLIASGLDPSHMQFETISNDPHIQDLMQKWSDPNHDSDIPESFSAKNTGQSLIADAHSELLSSMRVGDQAGDTGRLHHSISLPIVSSDSHVTNRLSS